MKREWAERERMGRERIGRERERERVGRVGWNGGRGRGRERERERERRERDRGVHPAAVQRRWPPGDSQHVAIAVY